MIIVQRALNLTLEGNLKPYKQISDEFGVSESKIRRILNLPEVKKYLANVVDGLLKEAYLDKIAVLGEIKKIAFSNISDFGTLRNGEMEWEEWENLTDEQLACVESVKESFNKFGDKCVEIKLYSKTDSLKVLTKMYEMLVAKSELTVTHKDEKKGFFDTIEEADYEVKETPPTNVEFKGELIAATTDKQEEAA